MQAGRRRWFMMSVVAILLLVFTVFKVSDSNAIKALEDAKESRQQHAMTVAENDTLVFVAPGPEYQKSRFYRIFWGTHYRELWTTPVQAPIFKLHGEDVSYDIYKRGGSQQTLKLKMERDDGLNFALRTVNKDQSRALPLRLSNTFVGRIFRDQASALHPYAGIMAAELAESAGLMHTNPQLFYVPADTSFGEYLEMVKGHLVTLEADPDNSWIGHPFYGSADTIIETEEWLAMWFAGRLIDINVAEYAKCRLLDIIISDWDRHSGQWRWAGIRQNGSWKLRPIIVDRDAAFYRYEDGIMNKLSLLVNPKFQTLDHDVGNLEALVFNGMYLDRMLLPKLSKEEWVRIASELKTSLNDEALSTAVRRMPTTAYKINGNSILEKVKGRRDEIIKVAEDYHQLVQNEITLTGTDKKEKITVRGSDNTWRLVMTDLESGRTLYDLQLHGKTTDDVVIFALGGDDEVEIEGDFNDKVFFTFIGGAGNDSFSDKGNRKGLLKPVHFIDTEVGNRIESGKVAKHKTEEDLGEMDYDRTGNRLNLK